MNFRSTQDNLIPTTIGGSEASQRAKVYPVNPSSAIRTIGQETASNLAGSGSDVLTTSNLDLKSSPTYGGPSAITISSRKKPRLSGNSMKDSIHKPFRSPVRALEDNLSNSPTAAQSTKQPGSSTNSHLSISNETNHQIQLHRKGTSSEYRQSSNQPSLSLPKLSASRKTNLGGTRKPFRSPMVHRGSNTEHSGDETYMRRIQIQSLQTKITELQSSIRKARQIVQQQENNEIPIEELIEKWKKACQEGAQVLLEKYIAQEQFFSCSGSWEADIGSNTSLSTGDYSRLNEWGYTSTMPPQDNSGFHGLHGLNPHQIEAVEDSMETQDLQYDLPTVEEAIHKRTRPDTVLEAPKTMTKMKRLLLGLGVDPVIIGYNVEQDMFTSEELPRESS
ncbi:hypothetical protein BGX27_001427 [Mortierella sp. AM989]|nr:hypothetical protein BGX27_001427 [Mortierella sp. AM989]